MQNYERNVTTGIGSIVRANYEKGTGADSNPEKENCTLEEVSELEEKFAASVSFLFLYCIF